MPRIMLRSQASELCGYVPTPRIMPTSHVLSVLEFGRCVLHMYLKNFANNSLSVGVNLGILSYAENLADLVYFFCRIYLLCLVFAS